MIECTTFLIKTDESIACQFRRRCTSQLKLRKIYSRQHVLADVCLHTGVNTSASREVVLFVAIAGIQAFETTSSVNHS